MTGTLNNHNATRAMLRRSLRAARRNLKRQHHNLLILVARIHKLEEKIDELELTLIEAQNPGIDMEGVKVARARKGNSEGV